MPTDRPLGPTNPPPSVPGQVRLSGRGLHVDATPELPVSVRQFEADLVDLTPDDPLSIRRGSVEVRIRHAAVALPADRLAAFLKSQLKVDALRNFQLRFQEPDRAIVTAEAKLDGRFTPIRLEGRLLAVNGQLGFKPLALAGAIKGFDLRWRPQTEEVELDATDQQLMDLLLPKLKTQTLTDVRWHLSPGNRVTAEGTLHLADHPGALRLNASLAPSADGRLEIVGQDATLDWRGLRMEANMPTQQAKISGPASAISRILEDELDIEQVRDMRFAFHPGNRFTATGEVKEGGAWRPVRIEGGLSVAGGALRVAPELVTVQGARGGIDLSFRPRTGKTEGTITQETLNGLLGPLAAREGFEEFNLRLRDDNRFVLEGVKVNKEKPSDRKRVRIEGRVGLEGGQAVRFDFEKIKYGRWTVDFGHLHVKLLQTLGLHLDDLLKIDEPFARMRKDTLFFYPGQLTDKIQGTLEALAIREGKLSVRADVATDLRELVKFKTERFTFDGQAFQITPKTISQRAAGTITGVSTGEGTIALDARLTPDDLQHIIRLKEDKVDFRGDRVLIDPNQLQKEIPGRVQAVETADGKATVRLGVESEDVAGRVPTLPGGALFNGQRITVPTTAIDKNIHGAITSVRVVGNEVRVQVGQSGGAQPGNQLEGALRGTIVVKGITIEDAEALVVDRTPDTPFDPRQLRDGDLTIRKGRAFVPRDRAEALVSEHLASQDLKGFKIAYAPGGLSVAGKWGPLPISGRIRVEGAGDRLAIAAEDVRLWKIPIPGWLATRLVGRLSKLPYAEGKLGLDMAQLGGVKFGPIREVRAAEEGLYLQVGE